MKQVLRDLIQKHSILMSEEQLHLKRKDDLRKDMSCVDDQLVAVRKEMDDMKEAINTLKSKLGEV